ncbi:glycine-rich RNA-binding protein 4, mitochondrial isoform X1 [Cinnamomum micranthum f. kanehirae]|uniref:Glycine-rich RNA-binding protein 4, mitochondrial isoform X1 n=1 Tax=Cinnamomum micranthum f. kanehirae TaxID=337451 RepID=A0A3S3R381_9MAGN|nr:glycine-rich RNA-binding protein 4, mitochondrial isoform X1 [Cinnamomum micranthum f. kanehirae]
MAFSAVYIRTGHYARYRPLWSETDSYFPKFFKMHRLPLSTTEGFLAKTFSRFGTVTKAKIITERSSKQSLGFAYVWFDCEEAAQLAVEDMDGKFVDGRFVAVTLARPESPTSHVRVHFFDQIGTFPIGPEFTPNMREL